MPRVPSQRSRGTYGELGTGPSAAVHDRRASLARLRASSRAADRVAAAGADAPADGCAPARTAGSLAKRRAQLLLLLTRPGRVGLTSILSSPPRGSTRSSPRR